MSINVIRRVMELKDNFIREKWRMTIVNLNSEISQTNLMYEACLAVKKSPFDVDKKQPESEVSSRYGSNNVITVPFTERLDSKRKKPSCSERFGGRLPFQKEDKTDPIDYFNENNIEINPLKNIYTEPRVNKREDKDKDFIRIEKKSSITSSNNSNKVVNHLKSKSKNEYEKENFMNANLEMKTNNILDFTSDIEFTMNDFPKFKHTHSSIDKDMSMNNDPPEGKVYSKSK